MHAMSRENEDRTIIRSVWHSILKYACVPYAGNIWEMFWIFFTVWKWKAGKTTQPGTLSVSTIIIISLSTVESIEYLSLRFFSKQATKSLIDKHLWLICVNFFISFASETKPRVSIESGFWKVSFLSTALLSSSRILRLGAAALNTVGLSRSSALKHSRLHSIPFRHFCIMEEDKVATEISKIDPEDVAELVRASCLTKGDDEEEKSFVIVDVRGDDYKGGHVKGSCNIPSSVFMERNNVVDQLIESNNNGPTRTVWVIIISLLLRRY